MNSRSATRSRRAVTLIEVLVTVAVAVILTLIVIVGMRSVRGQTLAMKDLHNLRLSRQDMLLWSVDDDEKFLNVGMPGSPRWGALGLPPGMNIQGIGSTYWGQQSSWNVFLAMFSRKSSQHWQSAYGLRTLSGAVGESANSTPPTPGTAAFAQSPSRFRYSPAFLTIPEMWSADRYFESAAAIVPYFAEVRLSQTRSPSGKALLVNFEVPDEPERKHLAFVDGSVAAKDNEILVDPAPYPLAPAGTVGIQGIHTLNGYRGNDK